ncbi:MAG TPA: hypothetical protein VGC64_11065, partial [Pyrinomonadaceae bacterium]
THALQQARGQLRRLSERSQTFIHHYGALPSYACGVPCRSPLLALSLSSEDQQAGNHTARGN